MKRQHSELVEKGDQDEENADTESCLVPDRRSKTATERPTANHIYGELQHSQVLQLCAQLSSSNPTDAVLSALQQLEIILEDGKQHQLSTGLPVCESAEALSVEECGGLDTLEMLQSDDNNDVYETAIRLLEEYFGTDEYIAHELLIRPITTATTTTTRAVPTPSPTANHRYAGSEQSHELVSQLCERLTRSNQADTVLSALQQLELLLEEGKQHQLSAGLATSGRTYSAEAQSVEVCGGLDTLEMLQAHENVEVSQISVRLIEEYFNIESDH